MRAYTVDTGGGFEPFVEREWLLTNGLGAFSSGTVVGCNTRKYHGLLCAAMQPPLGRILALSRVAEQVVLPGGSEHELSSNYFDEHVAPPGARYLRRFELDLTAAWSHEVGGVTVRKELLLLWRRNVIGLRYTVHGDATLRLRPFAALRDFHALLRRGDGAPEMTCDAQGFSLQRDATVLTLRSADAPFWANPDWWYRHTYPHEARRGQEDREDLYTPGHFERRVSGATTLTLWAGTEPHAPWPDWDVELERRAQARSRRSWPGEAQPQLARAAADFVVARPRRDGSEGTTILAGYPWFADWGRDTMIALPGLLLCTGRLGEAEQVLRGFAEHVADGLVPNVFDDYTGEPHYNTVDASLWFIHACHELHRVSGDAAALERLLPACRAIVEGYRRGTHHGIRMDEADGLIRAGDATTQLTWMDARCDGVVMTPRHGKPVEINALWYHALRLMGEDELAGRVAAGFQKFWLGDDRGLADVIRDDGSLDVSIRPNQIFAASLAHSPLSAGQRAAVVELVRRELLTPMGLRTLAESDPKFCGVYAGPQFERDRAYHNGTVWPWLLGPFVEAYLRLHGSSAAAREQARQWLTPLVEQMHRAGCVGQVSEIYEASTLRPEGCPAQAWSVGELLRLAIEVEL